MPQALAAVLVKIGVSALAATIIAHAAVIAATYFVSGLLRGGPPKPDASEREVKSPKPPRIHILGARRVFGSSMLFTNTSGTDTVDVWAFCEGPINAVLQAYLNDDKITISGGVVQALGDGSYGDGKVLAGYNLGADPNTAHAAVVSRVPTWTSAHRGDGIVSGYLIKTGVKSKHFLDIYPQGDNVTMSLAVEGHFVHDPRDPSSDPDDPTTWPYSDNAALIYLWFKTVFMGNDYAEKIAPVEQYWIDAANDCDEAVALAVGGTEPKYRGAIMFPADADPVAVDDQIRGTFDGWSAVDENGCIRVHSGKLYTPTVSVGPDQIVDYELQEFVEDENRLNEVIIRYVSAPHDYQEVECEPWRDESDILARGKTLSTTVNFQVPSHTQGRRLTKRHVARANAPQRGRVRVVFSAREALAERYIELTIEEAGETFFAGTVEVIGGERDSETGGAIIEWVAIDENVDSWNAATEDGDPAPAATKYYLPPLAAPTIDSAVATYDAATDGGTGVRIQIDATGPDQSDLTWFARWRVDGAAVWNEQEYTDADPGAAVTLVTEFVPIAAAVNVEVAYQVGAGRVSPWSATTNVDTRTDIAPPGAATAITLTSWSDTMNLTTDRIARASSYRWRFYQSDGTTLIRTIVTTTPEVSYSSAQAATDGPKRSYVVDVAGVNAAGAGMVATTSVLTLDAPAAVTNFVAADGATESEMTFDYPTGELAGFIIGVSTTASFDPMTQGAIFSANGSPFYPQGLAADTYYAKAAAYDAWTDRPDLLNFSAEDSFVISTGGGGTGGGGGWCITTDTLILMADGTEKPAGEIEVGDVVRTQHEETLEWGNFPVTAAEFVEEDVFAADIGVRRMRATGDHRIWLGGGWVRFREIGTPDGSAVVARITIADAHTYVANGVLSHNIKA